MRVAIPYIVAAIDLILCAAAVAPAVGEQYCGGGQLMADSNATCASGYCCSKDGVCGVTAEHCGVGCQSNCNIYSSSIAAATAAEAPAVTYLTDADDETNYGTPRSSIVPSTRGFAFDSRVLFWCLVLLVSIGILSGFLYLNVAKRFSFR
ncbi:unnamed protein product [Linum trigynum]|uniref:Chitin-binding type-1 domain-containing protein n=1 Tax=Linum trigynum TaxID=586398 RepID=A0AAV2DRH4_9ROSI